MMSETELSTGKHVYSQIYLEGKSIKENDRRGKKPMRGEKEKPKGEGGGGEWSQWVVVKRKMEPMEAQWRTRDKGNGAIRGELERRNRNQKA